MGVSEKFLGKMRAWMKPQYTAAFFGALIIGLICHIPVMTHNLPVFDTFWNIYSNQDMITSGRQFLTFACAPTSYFNLPWVNGLVSLFYLGITAVIFTELFAVEKKTVAVAVGGMVAAFPAVIGTFCFLYTADGYMLAYLLSALCVLLATKKSWVKFLSIPLLGFAIGTYQSYFSVTILLCIFTLVKDLLDPEKKIREILIKAAHYLVMGIGGYAFYVLTLKAMLALTGRTLSGYQGTDKVGGLALGTLPAGLKSAFLDFKEFTLSGGIFTENIFMKIAYVAFVVLAIGGFVYAVVRKKTYKEPLRLVLTAVLFALIPFGASLVCILSPEVLFHILMRMPWVVLFLFGLMLFEQMLEGKIKIAGVAGIAMAAVLIFNFILSANVVYFNLSERYEKTYGLCVRMVDRLEQTEGYETGEPVAILGGFPNPQYYPSTDITEKITRGYHETQGDYCVESSEKYAEFIKHYLGATINCASFDLQLELAGSEEFLEMPCFPMEGSIKKIRGIWVIKLNG